MPRQALSAVAERRRVFGLVADAPQRFGRLRQSRLRRRSVTARGRRLQQEWPVASLPFLLTDNELDFSKQNAEQSALPALRLQQACSAEAAAKAEKPRMFTRSGSMEEACVIAPTRYRAWAR